MFGFQFLAHPILRVRGGWGGEGCKGEGGGGQGEDHRHTKAILRLKNELGVENVPHISGSSDPFKCNDFRSCEFQENYSC